MYLGEIEKEASKMRKWMFLIVGVLVLACCGQGLAAEKPYAGQELRISFITGMPTDVALKSVIPEFEKETGMKATIIDTFYGEILTKNMVDLYAGTGAYDVLHVESIWFAQYLPYLYPLDEFMEDPRLFDAAEYDMDDFAAFSPLTLSVFSREGKLYGFPHMAGVPLNWYRKDLLKKAGLKPPQDLDEYYNHAKKLTQDTDGDGKIDIYGVALSGARSGLVDEWLSFFFSFGGGLHARPELFLRTTFNNSIGLKTVEYYKKLYDEVAPPESLTWEFGEVGSAMQRGVVAMMWNWTCGGRWYDDPETSTVVGKVGANTFYPARFGLNALSIPVDGPKKEASFEFIKWAMSKDIVRKTTIAGGPNPARASVVNDPELTKKYWWFPALRHAATRWARMYLEIPEWSAIDDALAIEFQKVCSGEISPEKALEVASNNAYEILEEAGYFKE